AEQRKNTHLVESIYGIKTIKTLALEGRRRGEWDVRVAQSVEARYSLGQTANVPQTISVPFERLIFSGVFLLGAYLTLIDPDTFQAGSLMAFIMLGNRAAQPIIQLAQLMQDYGEIKEAVAEVGSVVNAQPELTRIGTGLRQPISGNISFQDVSFRYAPGALIALDAVGFEVPVGTFLGVMGRSGSGKTTITRLLQGLNSQYEGIIKIDGMDLREIDLRHLRTCIGIVSQDNFLFSGTIRENIGIAKPHATFSEIVRVAQLAGAEEFIERLPQGYDTYLSEGAANLSGGQRQRLAIARALILDPPILILDEATSALDAESEAIINANLMRIAQGRTIICVSHRLAMLVNADKILVLEKGRLDDMGSHTELLHRNEIYKHMWYTQNRSSEVTSVGRIAITHHQ
ncbi:MAG TPA: peptidase domain-containing ABC transporter, partial [Sphingobium sp.]|nr:peptidase domain-containing ABC transporter [Sphingobium sp.]